MNMLAANSTGRGSEGTSSASATENPPPLLISGDRNPNLSSSTGTPSQQSGPSRTVSELDETLIFRWHERGADGGVPGTGGGGSSGSGLSPSSSLDLSHPSLVSVNQKPALGEREHTNDGTTTPLSESHEAPMDPTSSQRPHKKRLTQPFVQGQSEAGRLRRPRPSSDAATEHSHSSDTATGSGEGSTHSPSLQTSRPPTGSEAAKGDAIQIQQQETANAPLMYFRRLSSMLAGSSLDPNRSTAGPAGTLGTQLAALFDSYQLSLDDLEEEERAKGTQTKPQTEAAEESGGGTVATAVRTDGSTDGREALRDELQCRLQRLSEPELRAFSVQLAQIVLTEVLQSPAAGGRSHGASRSPTQAIPGGSGGRLLSSGSGLSGDGGGSTISSSQKRSHSWLKSRLSISGGGSSSLLLGSGSGGLLSVETSTSAGSWLAVAQPQTAQAPTQPQKSFTNTGTSSTSLAEDRPGSELLSTKSQRTGTGSGSGGGASVRVLSQPTSSGTATTGTVGVGGAGSAPSLSRLSSETTGGNLSTGGGEVITGTLLNLDNSTSSSYYLQHLSSGQLRATQQQQPNTAGESSNTSSQQSLTSPLGKATGSGDASGGSAHHTGAGGRAGDLEPAVLLPFISTVEETGDDEGGSPCASPRTTERQRNAQRFFARSKQQQPTLAPPPATAGGGSRSVGTSSLAPSVSSHSLGSQHFLLDGEVRTTALPTGERQLIDNKYVLFAVLGRGTYSTVYLALHRSTKDLRALKRIERGGEDSVYRKQLAEIAIMKRVHHPNILPLYEVVNDLSSPYMYLVTKAAKGPVVQLADEGRCPPVHERRLRKYMKQIASAVGYLHRHSIYHRDVKPDNILVQANDNILLADFGVSEWAHTAAFAADQKLLGTPAFLAPEVLGLALMKESTDKKDGEKTQENSSENDPGVPPSVDAPDRKAGLAYRYGQLGGEAIDMWAIGVTCFVMKFGYLPFDGQSLEELWDRTCAGVESVSMPSNTSLHWRLFFQWILHPDPKHRMTLRELRAHELVQTLPPISERTHTIVERLVLRTQLRLTERRLSTGVASLKEKHGEDHTGIGSDKEAANSRGRKPSKEEAEGEGTDSSSQLRQSEGLSSASPAAPAAGSLSAPPLVPLPPAVPAATSVVTVEPMALNVLESPPASTLGPHPYHSGLPATSPLGGIGANMSLNESKSSAGGGSQGSVVAMAGSISTSLTAENLRLFSSGSPTSSGGGMSLYNADHPTPQFQPLSGSNPSPLDPRDSDADRTQPARNQSTDTDGGARSELPVADSLALEAPPAPNLEQGSANRGRERDLSTSPASQLTPVDAHDGEEEREIEVHVVPQFSPTPSQGEPEDRSRPLPPAQGQGQPQPTTDTEKRNHRLRERLRLPDPSPRKEPTPAASHGRGQRTRPYLYTLLSYAGKSKPEQQQQQ